MSSKIAVSLLAAALCLSLGCDGGGGGDSGSSGGSGGDGTYAGTWSGNVCGRGLTMNMSQSGTSLSGTYTLTDPTFSEGFSGTVASETPPAAASLQGGADRHFEITFESHASFVGGYFKGASKVCDTGASK